MQATSLHGDGTRDLTERSLEWRWVVVTWASIITIRVPRPWDCRWRQMWRRTTSSRQTAASDGCLAGL